MDREKIFKGALAFDGIMALWQLFIAAVMGLLGLVLIPTWILIITIPFSITLWVGALVAGITAILLIVFLLIAAKQQKDGKGKKWAFWILIAYWGITFVISLFGIITIIGIIFIILRLVGLIIHLAAFPALDQEWCDKSKLTSAACLQKKQPIQSDEEYAQETLQNAKDINSGV